MAVEVKGVAALQHQLEKAKESLKDVDENIKKLTGREPGLNRQGVGRGQGRGGLINRRVIRGDRESFGGRGAQTVFRRGLEDAGIPPAKRQATGGAFSRLGPRVVQSRLQPRRGPDSGDEEDFPSKPAVQSSVIVTPKETVSRMEALDQQNKDEKGKARNRRMFGALLGTLQSFRKNERTLEDKTKQRQAIEEKLEEKAKEEKECLKKERQGLFNERRNKQQKLKRLEQKMELVKIHDEWESQTKKLMNFIRSKAKPPLFYIPKKHTSTTEKKLKESQKVLDDIITDRRKQLEEEIEELTQLDIGPVAHGTEKDNKDEHEIEEDDDEEDIDTALDTNQHDEMEITITSTQPDPEKPDPVVAEDTPKVQSKTESEPVKLSPRKRKSEESERDRRKHSRGSSRDRDHRDRRESERDRDRDRRKRRDSERDDKGRSSRRHRRDSRGDGKRKEKGRDEEKENKVDKVKDSKDATGENGGEKQKDSNDAKADREGSPSQNEVKAKEDEGIPEEVKEAIGDDQDIPMKEDAENGQKQDDPEPETKTPISTVSNETMEAD